MSFLTLHDPDALIRHRGIRAAIAMPTMFAIGELLALVDESLDTPWWR